MFRMPANEKSHLIKSLVQDGHPAGQDKRVYKAITGVYNGRPVHCKVGEEDQGEGRGRKAGGGGPTIQCWGQKHREEEGLTSKSVAKTSMMVGQRADGGGWMMARSFRGLDGCAGRSIRKNIYLSAKNGSTNWLFRLKMVKSMEQEGRLLAQTSYLIMLKRVQLCVKFNDKNVKV